MMQILRDEYSGDVHISTGMTTKGEIEEIVKFWEEGGHAKKRMVLYNCTSGYPVPFDDVCGDMGGGEDRRQHPQPKLRRS